MCLDPHLNEGWGWRALNRFKPSSKIFYIIGTRQYFFCRSFMFLFCLMFAMSLCPSVYMCFVVTCWERADLLALVCGVYLWVNNFLIGILCWVWYLIISTPDLCTLTYFGYNLDIMRQSAYLVLNPITVYSYGFLFNCTTVGQASDSMTALTLSFNRWVGAWCLSVAVPTVAQLEVFFSSDYLWVMSHFLCFIIVC